MPVDSASTYHDGNLPENKCAGVRSSLGGAPLPGLCEYFKKYVLDFLSARKVFPGLNDPELQQIHLDITASRPFIQYGLENACLP